jgi:hypothetical protein
MVTVTNKARGNRSHVKDHSTRFVDLRTLSMVSTVLPQV